VHAIVLAGGRGTRLRPYSQHRPKALTRFADYTILEIILRRLRACGFGRITLCISHLGAMIRQEFGDGSRLGLSIDYCVDERPLGTAAPLRLVPEWTSPALVMNGDLLTTVDFAELLRTHRHGGSLLTVAFQRRVISASVGLLRMRGDQIDAVLEKPDFEWNICSGIYVADPLIRTYIPDDGPVDMPGLIGILIDKGVPVRGQRFSGRWHDIGTPDQYQEALRAFLADPDLYLNSRIEMPS
jgi:NDP-mannose synthase